MLLSQETGRRYFGIHLSAMGFRNIFDLDERKWCVFVKAVHASSKILIQHTEIFQQLLPSEPRTSPLQRL